MSEETTRGPRHPEPCDLCEHWPSDAVADVTFAEIEEMMDLAEMIADLVGVSIEEDDDE